MNLALITMKQVIVLFILIFSGFIDEISRSLPDYRFLYDGI